VFTTRMKKAPGLPFQHALNDLLLTSVDRFNNLVRELLLIGAPSSYTVLQCIRACPPSHRAAGQEGRPTDWLASVARCNAACVNGG
jgi:hypothetical protein